MKKEDIKRHLQDYSIYRKRMTTINHAFASALSIADDYDDDKMIDALRLIGQDPESDLFCVYCDSPAETWDHILPVVIMGNYSGNGHQLGNLIPCCKNCNSQKGNRDWITFIKQKRQKDTSVTILIQRIETYIDNYTNKIKNYLGEDIKNELREYDEIKYKVAQLLKDGDRQAGIIRDKLKAITSQPIEQESIDNIGKVAYGIFLKAASENKLNIFQKNNPNEKIRGLLILKDVTGKDKDAIDHESRDRNKHRRYYKELIQDGDKKFLLCSQWKTGDEDYLNQIKVNMYK